MAIKKKIVERNIENLVEEYDNLSSQMKLLDAKKKELSNEIKKIAQATGTKDDKGSFYMENDNYVWGSIARKSISLNRTKAEDLFKSMGVWADVIVIKEEIDEDKVETLVAEERLSFDELESITDVKVVYSVSVKQKDKVEEMPEVQVAGAKKKLFKK